MTVPGTSHRKYYAMGDSVLFNFDQNLIEVYGNAAPKLGIKPGTH